MGTRDFFDLFKLNILKNSWLYFFLILWFVLFSYIQLLSKFLPLSVIGFLAEVQKILPIEESWLIPLSILKILFWVLAFLLFKELYDRLKDYIKRGDSYNFTVRSWKRDWIYNGKPKLLNNPARLRINSSRAGCLLKKLLWKDLEIKFKMQFFIQKPFIYDYAENLGIIFRAKDLENYFMLQILRQGNKFLARPHVRYEGMWEAMSDEEIGIKKSNVGEWFKIKLKVQEQRAEINIEGVGEFVWILPTHVDINHIEDGMRKSNVGSTSDESFGAKKSFLPTIEFSDSFGMIGFRAHLNEGADIRDLDVIPIRSRFQVIIDFVPIFMRKVGI